MSQILEDVVEEHVEEAAFLWQQRDAALRAPDYDLGDIEDLEERLEAHLDGIRIAGATGWEVCKEVGWDLAGEYFVAATVAIRLGDEAAVDEVLEAADGEDDATRGVISAFGWVDPRKLQGLVKRLLADKSAYRRRVGIGACAVHRVNPGSALTQALLDDDAGLRARAARAAGELGLVDCLDGLKRGLEAEDDDVRFWSAWSAVRLGSRSSLRVLGQFAASDHPRRRDAMNLALRIMPADRAQLWLRQLAADKAQRRWALIGSGIQGDPAWLPGLMSQFGDEELARVAGEAFEAITGLDIFRESFEVIPEVVDETPGEEEFGDQTVEELLAEADDAPDPEDLGEDEGLVVPDPEKMNPWYEKHRDAFTSGTRHLCGRPIAPDACIDVLASGRQRHRIAAALELGLATPASPLFEWRAPAARQRAAIRALRGG